MTTVTDKVKLDDDRVGIVKFVGEIHNKPGVFYGVEISKGNGLNSGNVGGDIYFPCRRNKGVFIRDNKIARSKPEDAAFPRITYGSRIDVPGKGVGTVKYVGYPDFRGGEQLFVGVELEEPNGKNDGTVQGRFYFRTAGAHGTFVPRAKIDQCTILDEATEAADEDAKDAGGATEEAGDDENAATEEAAPEEAATEAATEEPEPEDAGAEDEKEDEVEIKVGDGVVLDGDKVGLVRFAGENKDTRKLGIGLWYGIRLVEPRGNCDGTYKGVKYFKCPSGYGAMVQAKRITKKLSEEEVDFDFSADSEPTEAELARHAALEAAREKKKQIRAFRAKFKEIDTDGSMTIELDEFQRLMTDATNSSPEDIERLFYEIDITQSGAISFAEFDGWFQKQQGTSNIGGGDEKEMDDATAAISQALAADIQEDVDEDVADEMAAEDAAEADAEAEVEAEAEAEAEAEPAADDEEPAAEEPEQQDAEDGAE